MHHPALVKLGGSVITDKTNIGSFRRSTCKRLLGEISRSGVPTVLFHGAGSFGHPQVARHQRLDAEAVSDVLSSVGMLHAQVIALAFEAGLKPVSVPMSWICELDGDSLLDVPIGRIERLIEDGHTPVLCGTLARNDEWQVVSADAMMAQLAEELAPRLAVFASNVDGVLDGTQVIPHVASLEGLTLHDDGGHDVTGRMAGKLHHALVLGEICPTFIVNGNERGRLQDILKGKSVVSTRVGPA